MRLTEPDKIVAEFVNASRGLGMLYYQLFFPIFIGRDSEISKVMEISAIVHEKVQTSTPNRRKHNRLIVLPAVASAHALLVVDDESNASELRKIITTLHVQSFDLDQKPNREVLEIIWRTLTAVLLKNERAWQTFTVGPELINGARDICERFLSNNKESFVLLNAAISAWQFLITYHYALATRSERPDALSLRQSIASIAASNSPRRVWIDSLAALYKDRTEFNDMLPQSYEMLLGRSHFKKGGRDRRAANYFAAAGLQMWAFLEQSGSGDIHPFYDTERQGTENLLPDILAFYRNYGFTSSDWSELKQTPQGQLIQAQTIARLDDLFINYDGNFEMSNLKIPEGSIAGWISRQVPFRRVDDETLSRQTFSRRSLLTGFTFTKDIRTAQFEMWRAPGLNYMSTSSSVVMDNSNIIEMKKALEMDFPLEEPAHCEYFAEAAEMAAGELVHRTTITNPARNDLAELGVAFLVEERSHVPTSDRSEVIRQVREGRWRPLDPNNAVALRFPDWDKFGSAVKIYLKVEDYCDIRLPGRQTFIMNKDLQPLFDEFKDDYIVDEVESGDKIDPAVIQKLRNKYYYGLAE